MKKFQNARIHLRKNSKSGFTLVEMIVVIAIIAILVAALIPTVIGAIDRANVAADRTEARTIMMAASVWGIEQTPRPNGTVTWNDATHLPIKALISGGSNLANPAGLVFESGVCVGVVGYSNRVAPPGVTIP